MAKLVDMKRPKPKKYDRDSSVPVEVVMDYEQYPYGLRLSLGNEDVQKIPGLKDLDIKEPVSITARGSVISVNLDKSQDRKGDSKESLRIEIQIEQIAIAKINDGQGAFDEDAGKKD